MLCFSSLIHLLRDRITLHFLLFWFICLMGIAVAGRMIASRAAVSLSRSNHSLVRSRPTPPEAVSAILFGLFLAFYVAMILWREDFAFFDNDQLTDFSVAGRALPPPIWPSGGRFFPLAFQEFNALRFITRSPAGYQLFAVVQVLIVLLLLVVILRELRPSYRLLLMAALMLGPAFSIAFTGLVYPERDVLFWLVIMLFCLQRYSETRSPASFVTCLIGAHFVLYYKETVIVLIAAFAISYLCLEFYAERHAVRRFQQEFIRENALYFSLLAVCGVYVVFFASTMLPWAPSSYVANTTSR